MFIEGKRLNLRSFLIFMQPMQVSSLHEPDPARLFPARWYVHFRKDLTNKRNVCPRRTPVVVKRLSKPLIKQSIFNPDPNLSSCQKDGGRGDKQPEWRSYKSNPPQKAQHRAINWVANHSIRPATHQLMLRPNGSVEAQLTSQRPR